MLLKRAEKSNRKIWCRNGSHEKISKRDRESMNKQELKDKIKELIEKEDFKRYIQEEINYIIDSGFVDYEKEEKGSFGLAKLILYCGLRGLSKQYYPLSPYYKKEYKELLENYGN